MSPSHCVSNVRCPLFQFELFQTSARTSLKSLHIEFRHDLCKRLCDQRNEFATHQFLERHAMLDRGRCDESLGGVRIHGRLASHLASEISIVSGSFSMPACLSMFTTWAVVY